MQLLRATKAIAAAAVLALSLGSLSACGGSDSGSDGDGDGKGAIAMSFAGGDIAIWNEILADMKPIIEDAGYTFLTDDPQWDVQKQVSDWEAWIQRGDVKAMMAYPVQPDAAAPTTKKMVEAGIPVLGYAIKWDGVENAVLVDCKTEGENMGKDAAAWMQEHDAADTTVGLVGDSSTELGKCRVDSITAGLKSVLPDVDVKVLPGAKRDDGYTNTKAQLVADPETRVFLGTSDDNAQGAYQALIDSGVAEDDSSNYLVTAFDASEDTLERIASGTNIWSFGYFADAMVLAKAQSAMLIAAAEGKPLEDELVLTSVKVTADNAAEFLK